MECLSHLDGIEIFFVNLVKLGPDFFHFKDRTFHVESSGGFIMPCGHAWPVKELTIAVAFALQRGSPAILIFSLSSHIEGLTVPCCLQNAPLLPKFQGFAQARDLWESLSRKVLQRLACHPLMMLSVCLIHNRLFKHLVIAIFNLNVAFLILICGYKR